MARRRFKAPHRPEDRTPEQSAELEAYLSGESNARPDWLPPTGKGPAYFFARSLLTFSEKVELQMRDPDDE